jgi:hypothetical protein
MAQALSLRVQGSACTEELNHIIKKLSQHTDKMETRRRIRVLTNVSEKSESMLY